MLLLKVGFALTGEPDPAGTARGFVELSRNPESNPASNSLLWRGIAISWVLAFPTFGFAWLGLWLSLHALHLLGQGVLLAVFSFGGGFILAGAYDGLWRYLIAWKANERHRRGDRTLDDATRRLIRISRLNDWTLLIQLVAGIGVALGWIPIWI